MRNTLRLLTWVVLAVSVGSMGCANSHKMNRLAIGMTKGEVVKAMGKPTSTASPGPERQILVYNLYATGTDAYYGLSTEYFVEMIDGKVNRYGERGDFGSTQNPALDLNITNR